MKKVKDNFIEIINIHKRKKKYLMKEAVVIE